MEVGAIDGEVWKKNTVGRVRVGSGAGQAEMALGWIRQGRSRRSICVCMSSCEAPSAKIQIRNPKGGGGGHVSDGYDLYQQ